MRRVYRRDAELFNGTAAAGLLQEGKTRDQHKLQTLRRRMRGIVEDVLWVGGVLTTDEIYRGVKAKHAQLGQLLPPRWQEEVKRILEAHCISREGNSWFLDQARARPQDLPISTAQCSDHATEPGLGDGHHLYPDGARLGLSGPGHGVKRSASDLRPRSRFEFNSNPSGGSFANREGHLHLQLQRNTG